MQPVYVCPKMDSVLLHYDDMVLLKILTASGAETKVDKLGRSTPLMKAISREQYELVELLLEADQSVLNEKNVHDQTALMLAVQTKNVAIVKLVLKYVDQSMLITTDLRNETPLFYSIYMKSEPIFKLLLEADINKVSLNMPNKFGYTPAQASKVFKSKAIDELLSKYA